MKLDNSNKRISNIIAGILLVFVAIIFIAIALGVFRDNPYLQDKIDPLNSGSLFDLEDDENQDFVPVAQTCDDVARYHTVRGSVEIMPESNLIDIASCSSFEFPLCINPCDSEVQLFINDWYAIFEVCGGYMPNESMTQLFNLYQYNEEKDQWMSVSSDGTYIGWSLDWIQVQETHINDGWITSGIGTHNDIPIIFTPAACCCYTYWVAIIDASCNNKGCIDSDQTPDSCGTPQGYLPGKDLKLELVMGWCGCNDETQCFELILVQIFRIPNSRINI
jgi:hypothetical protein